MNNTLFSLLIPAFIAGILVLSTHVILGKEVLRRGIIFIDLAIAQMAALGVLVAQTFFHPTQWFILMAAMALALGAALLLQWTDKHWPKQQEAFIGCLFVVSASVTLLLLAHHAHAHENLHALLAGQILWVTLPDLLPITIVSTLIISIWWFYPTFVQGKGFYFIFAIAITLAVQLVGIYLVFASLIMPALATTKLRLAYLTGGIGYLSGLWLSAVFDLPAGAMIVCTLAIAGLIIKLKKE